MAYTVVDLGQQPQPDAASGAYTVVPLADNLKNTPTDTPGWATSIGLSTGIDPQFLSDLTSSSGVLAKLARQGGLTARYLIEGAMGLPNLPFDAAVKLMNMTTGSNVETPTAVQSRLMQGTLPEPATPTERIVGDVSRALVPIGGQIKTAANVAENAISPVARSVAGLLSQAPGAQAISGVTAGAAGGAAQETGYSPAAQYALSLLGGAAPSLAFAPAMARSVGRVAPTAEEAARAGAMADVGITNPPTAAVTRSPQDWAAWQELGKREGPAGDQFMANQQRINDQLTGVLPQMRVQPESTAAAQSEAARQAVAAYQTDAKNIASGTYKAAASAPGAEQPFPATSFWTLAKPVLETYEDSLPGVVKRRLQELQAGDLAAQGEIPAASGVAPRDFTVGEASKLYQLINDTTGATSGPTKAAGGMLKYALSNAADDATTTAPMPGATPTAIQLFKDATTQWRVMKQTLSPTPINALAKTTEANPSFLTNLFTGGKPGEIGALSNLLGENIPAAQGAMHDALLDYLQGQATRSANGQFSGTALGNAMDRVGPERLAAVLSPREIQQLNSLRTASEALTVAPGLSPVNRSSSASAMANIIRNWGLGPMAGVVIGHLLGGNELAGAAAGMVAEQAAKRSAGSKMAGMYGVPGQGPSFADLLQGRVLPFATGASVGAAQGQGQ